MDSMELRRDIAKHIRQFQPDTVITANFDLEAYGSYNQADHRVAGLMTVDAVRDADNPWVHRDLELPAHKVERLLVVNPGDPTHRVIVDEKAEQRGIESLACHKVYFEALPDHPKPEDFIPMMIEQPDGERAVSFRVFDPI
jgi:LmbE family N-acetylglucosaminyl deacetylase